MFMFPFYIFLIVLEYCFDMIHYCTFLWLIQEDRCQAGGIPDYTCPDVTPRKAGDMYLFGKIVLLVSTL